MYLNDNTEQWYELEYQVAGEWCASSENSQDTLAGIQESLAEARHGDHGFPYRAVCKTLTTVVIEEKETNQQ